MSTQTIRNGASIVINLQPSETLKVVAVSGTYTLTGRAGSVAGTTIAAAATGGTYGPYPAAVTLQLTSSALSEIDFDSGTAPVIESDTPAMVNTNPLTGVLGISVGGQGVGVYAKTASFKPQSSASVDIFDQTPVTDRRSISLPNPYSAIGPDLVHPSVVHAPNGWMGWKYWMAYTPYPNANSDYENPCIAVSNDGESWTTPVGLTNPLAGKPVGGYNADTHLVMDPAGGKLYLIYRERILGGLNSLKVMETSDGSTWTAPVSIMSGVVGTQDYASPSLFFDASAQRWVCISHNLDGGPTYPMQRFVSSGTSIYSGWGAASAISITNPTGGRTFWHSCFDVLSDGRVIGLIQDIANGGAGAPGALFAAESLDGGLTFAVRLINSNGSLKYYRPCFSLAQLPNGVVGMTAWIGMQDGTFSITREDWVAGAVEKSIREWLSSYSAFGQFPANILWFDNFNRADGAIGSPLVGAALTVDTGSFSIVSNRVQTASVGNNRALTTVSTADHVVEVDFVANPSGAWTIFRAVDTSNFYRVGFGGVWPNQLVIQSIVSGGVGSLSRTIVSPHKNSSISAGPIRCRVVCRGRRFKIYVNGVFWEEIQDPLYYSTGVKVGVQGTNAGAIFDNLLITS